MFSWQVTTNNIQVKKNCILKERSYSHSKYGLSSQKPKITPRYLLKFSFNWNDFGKLKSQRIGQCFTLVSGQLENIKFYIRYTLEIMPHICLLESLLNFQNVYNYNYSITDKLYSSSVVLLAIVDLPTSITMQFAVKYTMQWRVEQYVSYCIIKCIQSVVYIAIFCESKESYCIICHWAICISLHNVTIYFSTTFLLHKKQCNIFLYIHWEKSALVPVHIAHKFFVQ